MTVSVPRFAIKLAGRECSRWNLLITQFKYTGILPNKSSSKSKKLETKLASSLFGVGSIGGEWMLIRHLPCAAGFRGCGKVGILVLDFHSSTALSFLFSGFLCVTEQPPELWKCGNLAAFARFPRNCGSSGKPAVGFPLDPWFRHCHSSPPVCRPRSRGRAVMESVISTHTKQRRTPNW